ncbi:hypothetical protein AKA01nite_00700 [Alkalibacterium kapii]|uniref:Uncharacterized protein n=1 Tax=Alkalibacterium kapii TaxID=426704 RepID=A0A511AQJ7_9LACT|nr:hypothetical protein AKA01nite_00700 [Alkalibacterium kapii]
MQQSKLFKRALIRESSHSIFQKIYAKLNELNKSIGDESF